MTQIKSKAKVSAGTPMEDSPGLLGHLIRESVDSELWDLAEELGLRVNRDSPSSDDYRRVALALARLHHLRITPGKAGRRDEWLPIRLGVLFATFTIEKRRSNRRLNQMQVFQKLAGVAPWKAYMAGRDNPAAALQKAYQKAAKLKDAQAYLAGLQRLIDQHGEAAAMAWLSQFFDRQDGQPAHDLQQELT